MDTRPGWRTPLSALAVFTVACGTQDRHPLEPSSRSTLANVQQSEITGAVQGPDSRNVCRTVSNQDTMIVHAIPQSFELPFPDPRRAHLPGQQVRLPGRAGGVPTSR